MNRIEEYFRNISLDDSDYRRLVSQLRGILFNDDARIHILHGTGNNGISSFMKILKAILKSRSCCINPNTFNNKIIANYIAEKTFWFIEDTSIHEKMFDNNLVFRTLYHGKSIPINQKRLVITTNQNPNNFDAKIIPFNVELQNVDFNLVVEMTNNSEHVYDFLRNF